MKMQVCKGNILWEGHENLALLLLTLLKPNLQYVVGTFFTNRFPSLIIFLIKMLQIEKIKTIFIVSVLKVAY